MKPTEQKTSMPGLCLSESVSALAFCRHVIVKAPYGHSTKLCDLVDLWDQIWRRTAAGRRTAPIHVVMLAEIGSQVFSMAIAQHEDWQSKDLTQVVCHRVGVSLKRLEEFDFPTDWPRRPDLNTLDRFKGDIRPTWQTPQEWFDKYGLSSEWLRPEEKAPLGRIEEKACLGLILQAPKAKGSDARVVSRSCC